MLRHLLCSGQSQYCSAYHGMRNSAIYPWFCTGILAKCYSHPSPENVAHDEQAKPERQLVNGEEFGMMASRHQRHRLKQSIKKRIGVSKRGTDSQLLVDKQTSVGFTSKKSESSTAGQGWADTFGTLDIEETNKFTGIFCSSPEDDDKPHIRLSAKGRKNTPFWYAKKIEHLISEKKLQDALDVLEVDMLQTDRVMPNEHVFSALIGALARAGDTYKAFKMYNKMKKMGIQPESATFTALFNACANARNKEEGLKQAEKLRMYLQEKNIVPNLITYKAMIKAYALCNDIQLAFGVVDELAQHGLSVDEEVFRHLLIACISDKDAGFRHAIQVWHRMRKRSITPSTAHYNLLLRAIRDCGLGTWDASSTSKGEDSNPASLQGGMPYRLHMTGTSEHRSQRGDNPDIAMLTPLSVEPWSEGSELASSAKRSESSAQAGNLAGSADEAWWQWTGSKEASLTHVQDAWPETTATTNTNPTEVNLVWQGSSVMDTDVPNLLNPRIKLDCIPALQSSMTASQRLEALGGMAGYLSHMAKDGARPDMKTLTQLMYVMPKTREAEQDLLNVISSHGLKPDVNFFNGLIRQKVLRKDHKGVQEVLELLGKSQLSPDIHTFTNLARGCKDFQGGMQLLREMEEMSLIPTAQIMGTLLYYSHRDFDYKHQLLRTMKRLNILPDKKLLHTVEREVESVQKILLKEEREGRDLSQSPLAQSYRCFRLYYAKWLKEMELDRDDSHLHRK